MGKTYVSGAGVARGYHNRPVLTAEQLLRDPFLNDGTQAGRLPGRRYPGRAAGSAGIVR